MAKVARCSNKSLASMNAMPINFYLALVEGEACHNMSEAHHLMLEKSSMFNSFLNLENLLSSSGLVNMSAS